MQNINNGMSYLLGITNGVLLNSALSTSSSLIGKKVEVYVSKECEERDFNEVESIDNDEPKTLTGVVEGVKIEDGIVYMEIRTDETGELKSIEYGSLIKLREDSKK